jgi:predicted negative regulator of RcsB-dependent stress response
MKILIVILIVGTLGAGGWYYSQRQQKGAAPQASA